jgi:methionine synthase II (cobalamin-independent)
VPYESFIPHLLTLNAGYFQLALSAEKNKDSVFETISKNLRPDANGVQQMIYIGVTNTGASRVETQEEIRDVIVEAARWIGKDRIGATDDCGFSPFSIDHKPKCGGPDEAREIAFQKMRARVLGARLASEVLEV